MLINLIKTAVITFVTLFILLVFSNIVNADAIELKELSIEYKDFFPGGTDPLITQNGLPDRTLGKELNLNIYTDIYEYCYWNNTVHSMTDEIIGSGGRGQFRMVGWEFSVGCRLIQELDFGYYHFSRHNLDHLSTLGHFPVQDSLGIKIYLYQPKYRRSLF